MQELRKAYAQFQKRVEIAREVLGRPLTYAEKILYSHLQGEPREYRRGKEYAEFRPDRVAMQDATAQMALLQFMTAGMDKTYVPTTIHCDHLIRADRGAKEDVRKALEENGEVYDFLRSASERYGIGFWEPGSGIIHQVILEQHAMPGQMMIGTDSHTPNAGGLGMLAVGVGGADAVGVMAGMPWEVQYPKLIGVNLKGELNGWASPKDMILKLAGILTVDGGTGSIVEYFGEGAEKISCTGKATICNMGAEVGATTSIFPYDSRMEKYLRATGRSAAATTAEVFRDYLRADEEVASDPKKYFDRVVEIDLSKLEPHINGPHSPDRARPISEFACELERSDWPAELSAVLIGSCTNSSYEDMSKVASLARQAAQRGLRAKTQLLITPGSEQIMETIEHDGFIKDLESVGATVLA